MAEAKAVARPDLDIQEDILNLMMHYPPLSHDRHRVHTDVQNGHVVVKGYVKSPPTEEYLLNRIQQVNGVQSVNADELYNDEELRLQVGHVIPHGVFVTLEYGAVILSGSLPQDTTTEELVRQVGHINGVHRVVTSFW